MLSIPERHTMQPLLAIGELMMLLRQDLHTSCEHLYTW